MEDGEGRTQDEVVIDLGQNRKGQLDESFLSMFGGAVKSLLKRAFGSPTKTPYKFKGNKKELKSFRDALQNEKDYMEKFMKYGLDDPKTLKKKGRLEKAVKKFERRTGISWPFD